jgi:hypothetical protein
MTELERKIAKIRITRTIKNIHQNQIGYIDLVNIITWQLKDRGGFSAEGARLLIGYQVKYN